MVYQIEIYCAIYFQYSEVRFSYNDSRMLRVFQWRNTAKANNVGSKEALENPHSLIRYVTLNDCLEIHQRLHSVGTQRSRERTPWIKLVSRRSSYSTGVDWEQVNTPRFAQKLYFRYFGDHVNDYSKTKLCKHYQLPINLGKGNFILFIQRKMSR